MTVPAKKFAFARAEVKVEGLSLAAVVECEGIVEVVAGIVAVVAVAAVNTDGGDFAAALALGAEEVCSLGSGKSMVFFAAAKEGAGWVVFVGLAAAVTRHAADTSVAAAAAAVGGDVAAGTAADTSYSARPATAGAAIHSMGEHIALQLVVTGDLRMAVHLHHIPGKPSAYPRTAPSVAVEDTPAAVLAAEASYNIVAAAVADL